MDNLEHIERQLQEVRERCVRIETRLVTLARFLGLGDVGSPTWGDRSPNQPPNQPPKENQ